MFARAALVAATVVLAAAPALAQGVVPRLADGKPDFSGVWWSGGIGVKQNTLDQLERLYTPEARAIMNTLTEDDDPTLRCIPFGYPRAMTLPSNQQFQIVHTPRFRPSAGPTPPTSCRPIWATRRGAGTETRSSST